MSIGREAIKPQPTHKLGQILNKLQGEVKRLGQIKACGGIDVRSNSAGILLAAKYSAHEWYWAVLTAALSVGGSATAQRYERNTSEEWALISKDEITVWSPPVQEDEIADDTIIRVEWSIQTNKWEVVGVDCG